VILRRPTIIALRARRQAYDIAAKVAHPELPQPLPVLAVNAPPDERPPTTDADTAAKIKTLVCACAIIAASVGGFVLMYFRAFWPHR
jgi:hypothetical protein